MVRADVPAGSGHLGEPFHLADLETGGTLLNLWADRWDALPEVPVLIDGRDPTSPLTGGLLQELTTRAAATFAEEGVRRGDRVLWTCSATPNAIVGLLGALRLGAVVVPVSPSFTASELAYVVRDAAPSAALIERAEQGEWISAADAALRVLSADALVESGDPQVGPELNRSLPKDDALIVYTSGTTGEPKGAIHTHRSLLAGVQALRLAWGWTPEDRLILTLPLFHVHGLCAGLFGTLAAGASAVVAERFTEEFVLSSVAESTMFFGVPTMYHRLAETGRAGELSTLRLCVSGSAPLGADLWRRLNREGVAVLERYGMSETLLTLSNPLAGERRPGSVGTPLPGVEVAIDDADEHGVGELMVRGPSLCRAYWGRPGASASMWRDGWFATGDLASAEADGYVSIRGRRTELIITGGHNVYPAEVEAVLARHPSVAEIAVVGIESPEYGESVVAFVVGADGEPDIDALKERAAEELASFKRPRLYHVVDALPRNAMGKVVRRDLHQG
jgi:malonyl-CoA/methylmalonyl-CoA synthetase